MFKDEPMRRSTQLLTFTLAAVFTACLFTNAHAQTRELTSADRLALLYAPQLSFTRDGDPLIRVGIIEGVDAVRFTPDRDIRVLPHGEGGPSIRLPGGKQYTVRIQDAEPGAYRHLAIVNRLPVAERDKADSIKQTWLQRGYVPEVVEVGGLFAVGGEVFDSRTILIGVGGTTKLRDARRIKSKLEAKYGVQGSIHSEITRYPSGRLVLSGRGVDVTIENDGTLFVGSVSGKDDTTYTIPGIKKSYGAGEETRRYTGQLIFAPDRNGGVVGMVSLGAERVLKGTVPAETYSNAPKAALQAQAVAARNNMFAAIGVRNLADPYMLRGDVMDQVYGGIGVETRATNAAVDATRGRVMFYGKKIVEAVYSSNAGGFTESNENVWDMEPRPWLRGKPDVPKGKVPAAFANGIANDKLEDFLASDMPAWSKTAPVGSSRLYRWDKTVPASKAREWLRETGQDIGRIRSAKIEERGVSGRVVRLVLEGERGKATIERELNVRRLFGGLRSGLFVMETRGSDGFIREFSFRGAGFGHGVGMCQTGATGMAAAGQGFEEILGHYYTGIELKKLY
jgi:SpoIID/LytB domain protein